MLCHLEGKTHEEAARLLHWPVGTVSGRLSRGRELLRSRLKRRGMDVAPALLRADWLAGTPTTVALPLIESTVGAAIGAAGPAISASVLSLTQGVLTAMLLNKIKITALIVVLVGGMTTGVGIWGIQASHATTRPAQAGAQRPPEEAIKAVPPSQSPVSDIACKENVWSRSGSSAPRAGPVVSAGTLEKLAEIRPPKDLVQRCPHVVNGPRGITRSHHLAGDEPHEGAHTLGGNETAGGVEQDPAPRGADRASDHRQRPRGSEHQGKDDHQIAAYSPDFGVWVEHSLLKPVADEINPAVGPGLALYQAGNDFYAFTPRRLGWGVLHLEGKEEAWVVAIGPTDIEVVQGNQLYVFSQKIGEWSKGVAVYLPPGSGSPHRDEPAGGQKSSH